MNVKPPIRGNTTLPKYHDGCVFHYALWFLFQSSEKGQYSEISDKALLRRALGEVKEKGRNSKKIQSALK